MNQKNQRAYRKLLSVGDKVFGLCEYQVTKMCGNQVYLKNGTFMLQFPKHYIVYNIKTHRYEINARSVDRDNYNPDIIDIKYDV